MKVSSLWRGKAIPAGQHGALVERSYPGPPRTFPTRVFLTSPKEGIFLDPFLFWGWEVGDFTALRRSSLQGSSGAPFSLSGGKPSIPAALPGALPPAAGPFPQRLLPLKATWAVLEGSKEAELEAHVAELELCKSPQSPCREGCRGRVECEVIMLGSIKPCTSYAFHRHGYTQKATVAFVTLLPRFWLLCDLSKEPKSLFCSGKHTEPHAHPACARLLLLGASALGRKDYQRLSWLWV